MRNTIFMVHARLLGLRASGCRPHREVLIGSSKHGISLCYIMHITCSSAKQPRGCDCISPVLLKLSIERPHLAVHLSPLHRPSTRTSTSSNRMPGIIFRKTHGRHDESPIGGMVCAAVVTACCVAPMTRCRLLDAAIRILGVKGPWTQSGIPRATKRQVGGP